GDHAGRSYPRVATAGTSGLSHSDHRHRSCRRTGRGALHGGHRTNKPQTVRVGTISSPALPVPPLMSIVTGLMLAKLFPDVRGSGVPQTEAAYHLRSGIIARRVPLGKFITGVLCIGSGPSMGRGGPSRQIADGLAALVGQWLHLSPRRVRDPKCHDAEHAVARRPWRWSSTTFSVKPVPVVCRKRNAARTNHNPSATFIQLIHAIT